MTRRIEQGRGGGRRRRTRVQKGALVFGLVNVLIGVAGFLVPLVSGNDDGLLNITPGNLLGFLAIDWMHAGLHLVVGLLGVLMAASAALSRLWMGLVVVVFGLLAVYGWFEAGLDPETHHVRGMVFDLEGNIIHTLWTAVGVFFLGARPPGEALA